MIILWELGTFSFSTECCYVLPSTWSTAVSWCGEAVKNGMYLNCIVAQHDCIWTDMNVGGGAWVCSKAEEDSLSVRDWICALRCDPEGRQDSSVGERDCC